MLNNYIFLLLLLLCTQLNAGSSGKNELVQEFINSQQGGDSESVAKSKINYDSYLNLYEKNQLTEEQRYLFYKRLINIHEIRNWDAHLKSIVLVKFVNYDLQNSQAAYQKIEVSKSSFMELLNQFMKEEFTFLEEMKLKIQEDLRAKGIEAEKIELTEEEIAEAIDIVYKRLVTDKNRDYLF